MSPAPVSTGPPPPSLSVIAPTPRNFTFSSTHNLSDSPCPSPCDSPFEPELRTPPPSLDLCTNLSPSSSLGSLSSLSSPTSSRRRKASSLDTERRPKKGDEDYVKRPENAFMLFRRHYCEDRLRATDSADGSSKRLRQADLSKTISLEWKSLSAEERQHWQKLAELRKREHEEKYPGYVFRPQRARDADGKVKKNKKRAKRDHETDTDNFTVILPHQAARSQRRSLSAPTPPVPYQTVEIPKVYDTPSCPTSPSLLPLINRRSSHPGHLEDGIPNFDYLPNGPGTFSQESFESSELQGMFNMTGSYSDAADPLYSLLPAHQIITSGESSRFSIDSGSSGPSSPLPGPMTPTSTGLSQPFSQVDTVDWSSQSHSQSFDTQNNYLLPDLEGSNCHDQQFDYPTCVWGNNTYSTMWSSSSEGVVLASNDFDINAIPGIELVVPQDVGVNESLLSPVDSQQQCQHPYAEYQQPQYLDDGYFRYDEVINRF